MAITGSLGVPLSSTTERDDGEWCGFRTSSGDGLWARPAAWDHVGFIGGSAANKIANSAPPRTKVMKFLDPYLAL